MSPSSRRRGKRVLPPRAARSTYQRPSNLSVKFEFDGASSNASDSEGEDCELHAYDYRFDVNGDRIRLRAGVRQDAKLVKDSSHRAAMVLTRNYSDEKELVSVELEIRSHYILRALRTVIKSYPGVSMSPDSTGRIILSDEPRCLFHFRDELQAYTETSDSITESHLNLCMRYMRRALREEITSYNITMAAADPGLEHRLLWMAYKPGQLLYQIVEGVEVLSRLRSMYVKVETSRDGFSGLLKFRPWALETEVLQCSGTQVGFIRRVILIHYYEGCEALVRLPIYPLDHHPEKERIVTETSTRGHKYLSLLGIHHLYYDGQAKLCPYGPSNNQLQLRHAEIRHRIIVDCERFQKDSGTNKVEFVSGTRVWRTVDEEHLGIPDEEAPICDPWIQGYSLVIKCWGHFLITSIQEVQFNSDAFTHLVLAQEKKDLISALVSLQEESDDGVTGFDDLIKGKGKGLAFLLHGPPGVGKTFTAESIADRTRRPLFTINSGQIIGPAPWVERRLEELLSLATRWKALVLIDEADVFMQERTSEELDRNGLVSSLLRVMEYFEGILFLTTNRFDVIDSAFKSRIHLAISYPPLPTDSKKQLWQSLIARACNEKVPRWVNSRFLNQAAASDVNGREIKNIVRMAHGLARYGRRTMKSEDIYQGIKALELFDNDIGRNQGLILKKERKEAKGQGTPRTPIHTPRRRPFWPGLMRYMVHGR